MTDAQIVWNIVLLLMFLAFMLGVYVGMRIEKFAKEKQWQQNTKLKSRICRKDGKQ